MFVSFCLAWLITNGWGYILLGVGSYFDIKWAKYVGGSYIAFIWLPTSPEKLITIPLAVWFEKKIFYRKEEKK